MTKGVKICLAAAVTIFIAAAVTTVFLHRPAESTWVEITQDGKVIYRADSDALLVKGIVALLVHVLSGHTPKEIVDADLYFIDDIQLREHLSPTRSNGVAAMLQQMKLYALAFNR